MRNVVLALPFAYMAVLSAVETPVAVSDAVLSSLDTVKQESRRVQDAGTPVELYHFKGAVIEAKNLDSGETETLVSDAADAGWVDWTPSSGGVWILSNKQDGEVKFTVRYSLLGNKGQGNGSSDSPLKIVDGTEVYDLVKSGTDSDGFVFTVIGGAWSEDMLLPDGFAVSSLGDGRYVLEPVSDGKVYASAVKMATLYTDGTPPNRCMRIRDVRHISYSGDNWIGGEQAAGSELTLLSPSGASDSVHMSGTGLKRFAPSEKGRWSVSLETEYCVYAALIDVLGWGTAISIR